MARGLYVCVFLQSAVVNVIINLPHSSLHSKTYWPACMIRQQTVTDINIPSLSHTHTHTHTHVHSRAHYIKHRQTHTHMHRHTHRQQSNGRPPPACHNDHRRRTSCPIDGGWVADPPATHLYWLSCLPSSGKSWVERFVTNPIHVVAFYPFGNTGNWTANTFNHVNSLTSAL